MTSPLLVAATVVDNVSHGFEVPDLGVGGLLGCSLFDHGCDSNKKLVGETMAARAIKSQICKPFEFY